MTQILRAAASPVRQPREQLLERSHIALAKQKRPIFALVERGGEARVYHMPNVTGANIREALVRNARRTSRLHTTKAACIPRSARSSQRMRGCSTARVSMPVAT